MTSANTQTAIVTSRRVGRARIGVDPGDVDAPGLHAVEEALQHARSTRVRDA